MPRQGRCGLVSIVNAEFLERLESLEHEKDMEVLTEWLSVTHMCDYIAHEEIEAEINRDVNRRVLL